MNQHAFSCIFYKALTEALDKRMQNEKRNSNMEKNFKLSG